MPSNIVIVHGRSALCWILSILGLVENEPINRSIKTLIKKKTKVDRQKIKKLENEIIEKFSSKE